MNIRDRKYDVGSRLSPDDRREIKIRSIIEHLRRGADVVIANETPEAAASLLDEIRERAPDLAGKVSVYP